MLPTIIRELRKKLKLLRGSLTSTENFCSDISPIFVIGANRSGTSLLSHLLSQHPEVEGLFAGSANPALDGNGHSIGYCESYHLWDFLNDERGVRARDSVPVHLWGHPMHISASYRSSVNSKAEKRALTWAVQAARKTERVPLIKDQWNMLRIGMVKEVFPQAKFIMIVRDFKHYIPSCLHKWDKDLRHTDQPNIGLHWLLLNATAIYDLKKYADNSHFILSYAELFNKELAADSFQKLTKKLELSDFSFSFDAIDEKFTFAPVYRPVSKQELIFEGLSDVKSIITFEKTVEIHK